MPFATSSWKPKRRDSVERPRRSYRASCPQGNQFPVKPGDQLPRGAMLSPGLRRGTTLRFRLGDLLGLVRLPGVLDGTVLGLVLVGRRDDHGDRHLAAELLHRFDGALG